MAKLKEMKCPSESSESLTSRLKVFISSSESMTIDPVTSSVVASSSCLIELLLTILWAAFSFPRGKEVFYASPIICSSFQNREEPGSLWKTLLFVFGSSCGDNGFEITQMTL